MTADVGGGGDRVCGGGGGGGVVVVSGQRRRRVGGGGGVVVGGGIGIDIGALRSAGGLRRSTLTRPHGRARRQQWRQWEDRTLPAL